MSFLRWLPLALIALLAFWLRTHELDRRPMHADEANQAVKLGELLDRGRYAFDPSDHHGPTLYYAAVPIAWLRGERSLAQLTETTVRLVPALFGTISVVLIGLLLLPRASGLSWADAPAWIVAALLAVSPPSVYYSRYFIQETLLVTFTLGMFVCVRNWWQRRGNGWAMAAGICAGLMQATKENAPLLIVAAVIGAFAATRGASPAAPPRPWWRGIILAFVAALVTAALLYSSFGTNLAGLRDALATYSRAATRFGSGAALTGHEKPWYYYLTLFGWQRHGGFVWEQVGLSLLAVAGFAVAFTRVGAAYRWAAVYTAIVLVVFSAFPYKTPWHAVQLVPGIALLATGALVAISRLRTGKFVAIALLIVVVGSQFKQTRLAAFQRPADQRNPYAYVHSSIDVLKIRAQAEAARARLPNDPIWVISDEYWPLPWYLRGLPRVGYLSAPPADCDGALVITSAGLADQVRAQLRGAYRQSFIGLRPGVLLVVFTPDL